MVHAFMLVILLGNVVQKGAPMYFYNINDCNYFASNVVKRYGNYKYSSLVPEEHKATAYCKVVYLDPSRTKIY